jgi:adenylate cyclase
MLVGVFGATFPRFFSSSDELLAEAVWRQSAITAVERRIVLVDIDEKSLASVGPWPWSRQMVAQLIDRLDAAGVGLKLFDIVFPQQRQGDTEFFSALASREHAPNVGAQIFSLDSSNSSRIGQLSGAVSGAACPPEFATAYGFLGNQRALKYAGHITPRLDHDGVIRRVPGLVCADGNTYPALALAGLGALSADPGRIILEPASSVFSAPWMVRFEGLEGIRVPLSQGGDLRVPHHRPRGSLMAVSAADVIAGRVGPETLKGAWVVIGSSAFGVGDVVATAQGSAVNGMEVHAQLLAGILDDRMPFTPIAGEAVVWLAAILLVSVLVRLSIYAPAAPPRLQAMAPLFMGVVFATILFAIHAGFLIGLNWFVAWSHLAFVMVISGIGVVAAGYLRSRFETFVLYGNFSSYIPQQVAEKVAFQQNGPAYSATRAPMTVLCADLRNFSAFCERRPAHEAAQVLHEFFTVATQVIEAHDGVVEHMVGDSLLAVWNGPKPCDDHAWQAIRAAKKIWQQCADSFPDLSSFDLEPLDIGLGIESGPTVMGVFGPVNRRTHTLLGETVTVAVQLQALTADLASPILIGEGLAEQVKGDWKSLGFFLLPGLPRSRRIYELPVLSASQQQNRLKLLDINRPNAA